MLGEKIYAKDSFNRADNANTLGLPEKGGAWTALSATWGIRDNMAYTSSENNSKWNAAVIDTGISSNIAISATFAGTLNSNVGLAFRYMSAGNGLFLRCPASTGILYIDKLVDGAETVLAQLTGQVCVAGDNFKVELRGSNIKVYQNKVLKLSLSEVTYLTNTKHGIHTWGTSLNPSWNNFKVEAIK